MRLSVVIPCYNELNAIDLIIDAVKNAPYPDSHCYPNRHAEPAANRVMTISGNRQQAMCRAESLLIKQ